MTVKPYVRKQYWNAPTMSWWERSYVFEIVRGISITGGVFMKNMWRWMTLRKGALTTYYPEEIRADYAARNAPNSENLFDDDQPASIAPMIVTPPNAKTISSPASNRAICSE